MLIRWFSSALLLPCMYLLGTFAGEGRGTRSSPPRGTLFFGGNEELIGRMQANAAGKGRVEKSPRSNLTVAKASEAFKIKSRPPRAFLNVFHTMSKGGKHTHYSRRIGIPSPMLREGGSHHPPPHLNNLKTKGLKDFQSLRHQSHSNTTTYTGNLNRHEI